MNAKLAGIRSQDIPQLVRMHKAKYIPCMKAKEKIPSGLILYSEVVGNVCNVSNLPGSKANVCTFNFSFLTSFPPANVLSDRKNTNWAPGEKYVPNSARQQRMNVCTTVLCSNSCLGYYMCYLPTAKTKRSRMTKDRFRRLP